MNLILKIAWRNILRHKGKSLVIGFILFLGALLMTVGNGVISGMNKGLEKNFVHGFSGHVVIASQKQESDNVFFEFMGKAVEPINSYPHIKHVLAQEPCVDRFLPIGKNTALVLNEEGGTPGFTWVIGFDFKEYCKVFPDKLTVVEGRLLHNNERGILVPTDARKEMFTVSNIWFIPENDTLTTANLPPEYQKNIASISAKDSVVLMGFNNDNSTTDIRIGIKGIVKHKELNTIFGKFSLMDIESYRECLGYLSAQEKAVELTQDQKKLLSLDENNLDALFGRTTVEASGPSVDKQRDAVLKRQPVLPAGARALPDLENGTYNLVLVLLKDGFSPEQGAALLNKSLKAQQCGARAITWKKASGMIGSTAVIIKGSLFLFVMTLFFVAIIIIVNTLSMAALERTSEIGMMRAVGARKSFISKMFFCETAILSFLFGGIGIVLGIGVIRVLASLHLTTTNDMVQLLYGGDSFFPLLTGTDIALSIIQLIIVTGIAVLYPLKVARSITPLDAISRD